MTQDLNTAQTPEVSIVMLVGGVDDALHGAPQKLTTRRLAFLGNS